MRQRNEFIGYAMDCASYLISKIGNIDRIILYGSMASGDYDEESDVDLFIDAKDKKIEKKINGALKEYYKTRKFREWELKGIQNEFSIIVGNLDSDEWKDLKRAIVNTGIILFGKYKSDIEKINHYTLFSFENIKSNKKRIAIYRKLFGFKVEKKKYFGIAEKINTIRIGKGALLVPVEHTNELKNYLHRKKVAVRLYDLWGDRKF